MSSNSAGQSYIGVDIALAGLSFQVFTLTLFICLATDYAIRYSRGRRAAKEGEHAELNTRFQSVCGLFKLRDLIDLD